MTDRVEVGDVVITGAGGGAGRAFAVSVAREGVSAGGMVLG
jgi:hypothetical protein